MTPVALIPGLGVSTAAQRGKPDEHKNGNGFRGPAKTGYGTVSF